VEAAALVPTLALVIALLVQPICLSYTRMLMRNAAVEAARCAATAYGGDLAESRSYALRRLRAVPELPLFHVGGERDWQVEVASKKGLVEVTIVGHARPLPLVGTLSGLAGRTDDTGVVLAVSVREALRPAWLKGGYDAWQRVWG
jgi:hypothetical protein